MFQDNVIVIDYFVIMFIRNHNWAGGSIHL